MKKTIIFQIITILLIAVPGYAQLSFTQHFSVSNGLSNNFIHGIVQDSKGRTWIATESGLNCFDGYHFITYKSHNSELKSNYINTLYRDDKHRQIWVGVKGLGIYLIHEETGIITNVSPHHINIGNVMAIVPAADGGVWFASHDKILHYSYQQGKFSLFLSQKNKEAFRALVDDGYGKLIVAKYDAGLKVIDIKRKKEKNLIDAKNPINKEVIYQLRQDKKSDIWMATNHGARLLDTRRGYIKKIDSMGTYFVYDILPLENYILAITNNAIKKINPKDFSIVSSININNASCIYRDPYNNFWYGTLSEGIYLEGKKHFSFKNVLSQNTNSIISDGQKVWAGGLNALYLLENGKMIKTYSVKDKYLSDMVLSLQKENDQSILLAIYGKLLRFDVTTGETSEILYHGKRIPAITFYKDFHNTIWITSLKGIYSLRNGEITYDGKLNKILGNQMVNCMRIDKKGRFWIGTLENGMFAFDKDKNLINHFIQSKSFFSNSVMHMQDGFNQRIWLATSEGIGLVKPTVDSFEIIHYNHKQGLKDPFIRAVREDKLGNVWVSTNNGLSYLNMKTEMFSNFDQNDGIPTNNFTGGLVIMPNGMAYITSTDGIIAVNTKNLTKKRQTSPVHFTRCTLLNTSVGQMSEQLLEPDEKQVYHLDYHQNNIRIDFSVENKEESKLVDYSYQVDNLMDSWALTDENTITFRSLRPGKYCIRVRARLHGQNWESASTNSITIIVSQPWWWSWWAKILYLCLIGCCIYLYFHRYKQHLRIKNDLELERKKNLVEQITNQERQQFFTNITHELRTPLTLVYAPLEELAQSTMIQNEDKYKFNVILKNLQRLMDLVNRLLEFRKVESNNQQLIVCKGNLKETIQEIGNTFKSANSNPAINYVIDIEQTSPNIYFDKNVLKSILSNLLSNAVKYTLHGSIGLSLHQLVKDAHQYSCIKVYDTGCGIDKESLPHIFERYYQVNGAHQASGTGIGLALVEKLCEQHKIQINVESKLGSGTIFTLLLDNAETYEEALHQEESILDEKKNNKEIKESFEVTPIQESSQTSLDIHPTVLIVEDHTDINDYIAHVLENDYHVIQARNGEEGLQMAKKMIPDIIVCDIMMPIMDGLTMTRHLKEDICTSHIPIIILTAKTDMQERLKSYKYGATSFITKPFSIAMIKSRISNLLAAQKHTADYIMKRMALPSEGQPEHEEKEKTILSFLDQQFIDQVNELIIANIASDKLSLNLLAKQQKISLSTLYRKMKALTGVSGNEYIRKMRLNHSLKMMLEEGKNISEAAYESGFVDMPYFRNCFKEEFGEVPSEYIKKYGIKF